MPLDTLYQPPSSASFRGAIKWIVIVSFAVFLCEFVARGFIWAYLGLVPSRILHQAWIWQPVTYLFVHGSFIHWLFNMLTLWMFGRELEARWGTAFFVRYYFVCGLGAALCLLVLMPNLTHPTIGASGAIFGVLIAFALMFPHETLYLYFFLPLKTWQAVALFAVIDIFAGLEGNLSLPTIIVHLGGMATGYLYLKSGEWRYARWSPRQWTISLMNAIRSRRRKPVVLHEVTDDLVKEVDRILEKVLREGADSLTPHEKQLMERYSKRKH
jgi:membrane associated rhomboid family serine protease